MRTVIVTAMVSTALLGCGAEDVRRMPGDPPPGGDALVIDEVLFAPGEVLDHQRALGLDDAQVRALGDHLRATQTAMVDLEIRARRAREALRATLAAQPIDEQAAMSAARELAGAETAIELAHLELRIRIRSALTDEQQRRLAAIRAGRGPR